MIKQKVAVLLVAGAALCLAQFSSSAQTRILPLGDSVTSAYAPHSSYRYWLWNKLTNAGFNIDFVGTQQGVSDGEPDKPDFDQDHEGHPGWTAEDGLWNLDWIIPATQPDIVLLDLGANDIIQGDTVEMTIARLEAIIATLRAANPNVIILVAEPTPYLGPNHKRLSKLKGAISHLAKQERRQGANVIAVNLFGGFKVRKDTTDGMHPDESGEVKIANKYFAVLKKQL